ncbi:MAG: YkgJ family cysteine cluster protein [Candidatus Omnitrophica bacterium]|nr:YkgJ family cysteine cluster protein [Candidatus Omnitrophota bacterium]
MILSFKQFVTSSGCLQCKGCCRYHEADSAFRPRVGQVDKDRLAEVFNESLVLDTQSYVTTTPLGQGHLCRFLHHKDSTCGIYAQRPFECVLYPFILSKTVDALKLYVHLGCPFVQDHMAAQVFDEYKAYLKDFFGRYDFREFLIQNKDMFHDYTPYAPELLYLFDLPLI